MLAVPAPPNRAPLATHRLRAVAIPADLAPGLLLAAAVAAAASALHQMPGLRALSPMILAILVGIAVGHLVGVPARARPGLAFAMRRVLRLAVVLLGLQLTAAQVAEVGLGGLAVIAASLVATFLFTVRLGRRLGVDQRLAELIAAGTSICGASAVIAANTVTRAPDEDVAYAVACVTVFGSVAMLAYPLLPGLLHLGPHAYGLWAGASIHEIAQVVAAAYQAGREAGEFGTVAKLSRVILLAPVVLTLGALAARRARGGDALSRPPLPWFVLGFVALVGVNSLVAVPEEVKAGAAQITTLLLTLALAAMGLETSLPKLRAKGLRPLLLGGAASAFIALFSLALVQLVA